MIQQRRDLTTLTRPVPKVFDAGAHAVADYATAGAFAALGLYLHRRNRRAARLAYANAAAIVGLSMLTDYPGGVFPVLSFRAHGQADLALTALTAAGPAMLGIANDPAARMFYGAAGMETAIVSSTDWSSGGNGQTDEMYVTPREEWRDGPEAPWNT
jgi:hypothetical protein